MNIRLLRWHITLIAVLSIIGALSSIFGSFPTPHSFSIIIVFLKNIFQAAARDSRYALTVYTEILLLLSAVALLFQQPWSKFGYALVAILFTGNSFYGSYALITLPDTPNVTWSLRYFLVAASVVKIALYWLITALIFRYFRRGADLTNRSTPDTPPEGGAPVS